MAALKAEIAKLCLAMDTTKRVLALKTQAISAHKKEVATRLVERAEALDNRLSKRARTAGGASAPT